jgi:hypothetical protein
LPGRSDIALLNTKSQPALKVTADRQGTTAMRNSYTGPAMTLDNMRALGVRSIDVKCGCGRVAIIDFSNLSGLSEIPALLRRLKCTECAAD